MAFLFQKKLPLLEDRVTGKNSGFKMLKILKRKLS